MLDIHGVLDTYPIIINLMKKLVDEGAEVYVVSGPPKVLSLNYLSDLSFEDNYFPIVDVYSIVDILIEQQIPIISYESNRPQFAAEDWDCVKGNLAAKLNIDIVFDDTIKYAKYFPDNILFLSPVSTGKNYSACCGAKNQKKIN